MATKFSSEGTEVMKTEEAYFAALQKDARLLQFIENQTEALCIAAVQKDGYVLYCVKDQT